MSDRRDQAPQSPEFSGPSQPMRSRVWSLEFKVMVDAIQHGPKCPYPFIIIMDCKVAQGC